MRAPRLVCAVAAVIAMLAAMVGAEPASASTRAAPVPNPIWGVTLDCGYTPGVDGQPGLAQLNQRMPDILTSLTHLAKKPTVRVVFDENANPSDYISALQQLHGVANIMGELLDSSHLADFNTTQYRARAVSWFDTLGGTGLVDIWEIGNEVNGSWTQNSNNNAGRQTTAANIAAAYDEAASRGLTTALTLFYDTTEPAANQLFSWVSNYLAARVKTGVNYALISYYNSPTGTNWPPIFTQLASTFPNAGVGFGEIGGTDQHSNRLATANALYGLGMPTVPTFVGGYFYWYFCSSDGVPYGGDIWTVINQKISSGLLLSQWQPATASSIESSSLPASNAVDGKTTTRWASAPGHDPQWLRIDLGAIHTIDAVSLNWEAAYAKAYQVQTSVDGSTWTSIYSTSSGGGGVENLSVSGTGRYVRMYGTARNTVRSDWGYSLWEMQIYGS